MSLSISLSRVLKYGSLNLWRNRWLSVTAITVMTITLLILSSLMVFNQLAGVSSKNLQEKVDVSISFHDDVTVQKVYEVKTELEGYDEVQSVRYISSEDAKKDFIRINQNNPTLLESLKEFETSPLPQYLVVKTKDISLYNLLNEKLSRSRFQPLFSKINYEDIRNLIDKLTRITAGIGRFGIGITIVFGLVACLVIFNTLRLTIFSRREEIEIMRLVGASNWFIRGPFIVEGLIYGLLATILASVILYSIMQVTSPTITRFFQFDAAQSSFFNREFWMIILTQLGAGMFLGVVSSLVATKKHLHV